jgi:hypothetical protein
MAVNASAQATIPASTAAGRTTTSTAGPTGARPARSADSSPGGASLTGLGGLAAGRVAATP